MKKIKPEDIRSVLRAIAQDAAEEGGAPGARRALRDLADLEDDDLMELFAMLIKLAREMDAPPGGAEGPEFGPPPGNLRWN